MKARSCYSRRNESNTQRLSGKPNASVYVKDAFHECVISGRGDAVNPGKVGAKAAAHYILEVPGGGSKTVSLRLSAATLTNAFDSFERTSMLMSSMNGSRPYANRR